MENAVEALKIAFGVMMFVLALSLSISCISQANYAVTAIVGMSDRETEYTYVKLPESVSMSSRIVGVETVIPTMYKAYEENFEIYFLDESGNPLPLYYATDSNGERIKNDGMFVEVNHIDLEKENFGSAEEAKIHLDILLANPTQDYSDNPKYKTYAEKYKNQHIDNRGLYEYLSDHSSEVKFIEQLGEYYQEEEENENKPEVNKVKKRVITYKKVNL